MSRFTSLVLAFLGVLFTLFSSAQSPPPPTPSASPSAPLHPPKISPSPATTPTSAPTVAPTTEELINSLSSADVQTAIGILKNQFTNPEALNETQLNRATLEGLVVRLGNGLLLLPGKGQSPTAEKPAPFYAEMLDGHIAYLRTGTLSTANLEAMDKKLAEFAANKADALVLDLRASGSGDFATAAEFTKRFVPKGRTLFTLRKQGKQDRAFASDRDPLYTGLIVLLADRETAGAAEACAAAVRFFDKALIIGQTTGGSAVEYS
ncbi:MAG: carboxyl-terminal protease, partial [Spartobacteria bacterium]|nr:carboxyl-terminal protease [Spartobacteria bacterium]